MGMDERIAEIEARLQATTTGPRVLRERAGRAGKANPSTCAKKQTDEIRAYA